MASGAAAMMPAPAQVPAPASASASAATTAPPPARRGVKRDQRGWAQQREHARVLLPPAGGGRGHR
eukprot:15479856-Alexandrium_andersonii.AAC.1